MWLVLDVGKWSERILRMDNRRGCLKDFFIFVIKVGSCVVYYWIYCFSFG